MDAPDVRLLAVGWSGLRGVLLRFEAGTWIELPLKYASGEWSLHTATLVGERALITGFDVEADAPLALFSDGAQVEWIEVRECAGGRISACDVGPDNAVRCVGWRDDQPLLAELEQNALVCRELPRTERPARLYSIDSFAAGRALAVGEYPAQDDLGARGLIYALDQGTWAGVTPVGLSGSWLLTAVDVSADGLGYMVGQDAAAGLLMRWDNGKLTRIDLPRYADAWTLFDLDCDERGQCLLAGATHPGEGLLTLWRGADLLDLNVMHPARTHAFQQVLRLQGGGFALAGAGYSEPFGFVVVQQNAIQQIAEFPELDGVLGYGVNAVCELPASN